MKKLGFLIAVISISVTGFGQNNQSLSEKLWKQVQDCYSMFEDSDNDGQVDTYALVDDSQNGYLEIAGTFPTCGCNCENTIGAYKTNIGEYLFLKESFWGCSWRKSITSSKSLNETFPIDFEVDGFFSKKLNNPQQSLLFYIDVEIPRTGTDTKVTLKQIPIGLNIKSKNSIGFGYDEEDSYSREYEFYKITEIVSKIKDENTLNLLLDEQFDKISAFDMKIVNDAVGDKADKFKTKEELVSRLQELKHRFDLFSEIKHQWLILGWNRENGTFFIKEKGTSPEVITFKEFLRDTPYYMAIC